MAKYIPFKRPKVSQEDLDLLDDDDAIEGEVMPDNFPSIRKHEAPILNVEGVSILDSLAKAGYPAIADKLRSLQVTEGLEALEPFVKRIGLIEKRLDQILQAGLADLDVEALKSLLAVATDALQSRAKALLLPYGTISPRTAMQRAPAGTAPGTVVQIGIGSGVTPRPKHG